MARLVVNLALADLVRTPLADCSGYRVVSAPAVMNGAIGRTNTDDLAPRHETEDVEHRGGAAWLTISPPANALAHLLGTMVGLEPTVATASRAAPLCRGSNVRSP